MGLPGKQVDRKMGEWCLYSLKMRWGKREKKMRGNKERVEGEKKERNEAVGEWKKSRREREREREKRKVGKKWFIYNYFPTFPIQKLEHTIMSNCPIQQWSKSWHEKQFYEISYKWVKYSFQ